MCIPKKILTIFFILYSLACSAQDIIHWDPDYELQFSDFRSAATSIGSSEVYTVSTSSGFGFSAYMTNAEFLFTRHFNSKVYCTFNRDAGYIVASDSAVALALLNFARFDFDLSELYARKLRQKLYEEKNSLGGLEFVDPIYNSIQAEYAERVGIAGRTTELGQDSIELHTLHERVLKEIEMLPDFCKTCVPPKRKKEKKK